MIFNLAEAVVSCLDRESARRLVKFRPDDAKFLNRIHELEEKEKVAQLTPDERMELMIDMSALQFIGALQLKARAMLRRPPGSKSSSGKREAR
jgi:hypothetical protein